MGFPGHMGRRTYYLPQLWGVKAVQTTLFWGLWWWGMETLRSLPSRSKDQVTCRHLGTKDNSGWVGYSGQTRTYL